MKERLALSGLLPDTTETPLRTLSVSAENLPAVLDALFRYASKQDLSELKTAILAALFRRCQQSDYAMSLQDMAEVVHSPKGSVSLALSACLMAAKCYEWTPKTFFEILRLSNPQQLKDTLCAIKFIRETPANAQENRETNTYFLRCLCLNLQPGPYKTIKEICDAAPKQKDKDDDTATGKVPRQRFYDFVTMVNKTPGLPSKLSPERLYPFLNIPQTPAQTGRMLTDFDAHEATSGSGEYERGAPASTAPAGGLSGDEYDQRANFYAFSPGELSPFPIEFTPEDLANGPCAGWNHELANFYDFNPGEMSPFTFSQTQDDLANALNGEPEPGRRAQAIAPVKTSTEQGRGSRRQDMSELDILHKQFRRDEF